MRQPYSSQLRVAEASLVVTVVVGDDISNSTVRKINITDES